MTLTICWQTLGGWSYTRAHSCADMSTELFQKQICKGYQSVTVVLRCVVVVFYYCRIKMLINLKKEWQAHLTWHATLKSGLFRISIHNLKNKMINQILVFSHIHKKHFFVTLYAHPESILDVVLDFQGSLGWYPRSWGQGLIAEDQINWKRSGRRATEWDWTSKGSFLFTVLWFLPGICGMTWQKASAARRYDTLLAHIKHGALSQSASFTSSMVRLRPIAEQH